MGIHHKARLAVTIAALSVCVPAFGAEKVHITGSTSVLLPKPTDAIEESKRLRIHDGPSGRSEYEGGLPGTMTPAPSTSPQADKKFMDALDKKRNWIFMNPYETQYDSKTEQFLRGEKGTGLFSHRLMQSDDKGIVERFIQERNPDRETLSSERLDNEDPTERDTDRRDFQMGLGTEALPGNLSDNSRKERGFDLPPAFESKSILVSERNDLQKRLERTPFSDNAFRSGDKVNDREIFTREERAARDAELSKIYEPRISGAATSLGAIDPLNHSIDATRQEATPFSGRRSEQLFNFGRSQPSSAAGNRNSPIISGPSVAGPGSAFNSSLSRSSFDFNSRVAQPSPFAPSVSAAPAQAPAAGISAPFVLPRPQRKF